MLALVCLFSFAAGAVHAQEQETDISKKLQTRNVEVARALFQNKSFLQTNTFYGSRNANVGEFYFIDKTRTKEFLTTSFYKPGSFWAGNFLFHTSDARTTGRNLLVNATAAVPTATKETKDAREAGKESQTRAYPFNREFRGRGRSQDRLDKEGEKALYGAVPLGLGGNLHPMTIDEVRELLNKNK